MQVKRILNAAYDRASTILKTHETELHALAQALLDKETLSGKQIMDLMQKYPSAAKKAAENVTRAIKESPPKGIL